jgi:hypothetical protein
MVWQVRLNAAHSCLGGSPLGLLQKQCTGPLCYKDCVQEDVLRKLRCVVLFSCIGALASRVMLRYLGWCLGRFTP